MEVTVNRRKWGIISLTGTVGFFFAIAPVLDPYIVIEIGSGFTLKINDVIMLFLTMLCFSKSYRFERKTGFLCIWLLGLGLIGIFGNLASNTDMANSFKNLIVWLIYAIATGSFDCCASPIPKKAAFLSSTTEKHSNHLSTSTELTNGIFRVPDDSTNL